MEISYTHHFFPCPLGGLMIVLVPNGPYRKQSQGINLSALIGVFENQNYVLLLLDIFAHVVIRFWAFTPLMLQTYNDLHPETTFNIPILSFLIIGIGGLLVLSGYLTNLRCKTNCIYLFVLSCVLSCFSFLFAFSQQRCFLLSFLFFGNGRCC
jgi:hypothetical protein